MKKIMVNVLSPWFWLGVLIGFLLVAAVRADYEAIKRWDEPLICTKINDLGKKVGKPVKLLWDNFLTFDDNGRMIFLKLSEGLHKVPMKGWICVPESIYE